MKYIFLVITFISFAQQNTKVDFKSVIGKIAINTVEKSVSGNVIYDFRVTNAADTIKIDAINMTFTEVKINNKSVNFKVSNKQLLLFEGYKSGKNLLSFSYKAKPKQALYFVSNQIWTQGQGKYTSHWFPSFDDTNEKVIFGLDITFDKKYQVISNGVLKNETIIGSNKLWKYRMSKPMSSYLLMLTIGDFEKQVFKSKSGIPIQLFIKPDEKLKFEPTYRYSKVVFDFLEKEIGFNYPWKIYSQIPVHDFLYAGMENTSATIFAQDFVVDSIGFNDRNYINVNAHELAHQWFGNLVTAKSGKDHWLQEGFATYYALLAEKEVFGEDYFYYQLYKSSLQLKNAAKTDTIPVMNEKASSLSFYQKGAWALHTIRESIGEKVFKKVVQNYIKKYAFQNVDTDNFLTEIRKVSNFDTEKFRKQWLEEYKFNSMETSILLNKNTFIKELVNVQKMRDESLITSSEKYKTILKSDSYYPVKTEILYQIKDVAFEDKKELLQVAMQTNSLKVRQAVAEFTTEIPIEFKSQYETLLDDGSYETREIALIRLITNFKEDENNYLERAKNWMGNNDLGLRTTVLFLSQNAIDYDKDLKTRNLHELINYTSPIFESSIRQNAFQVAVQLEPIDTKVLKNLVNATTHFKWQFNKYAKDYIRYLLKTEKYGVLFKALLFELPDNEKSQLQKLIKE